jgi:hypothetical protein
LIFDVSGPHLFLPSPEIRPRERGVFAAEVEGVREGNPEVEAEWRE